MNIKKVLLPQDYKLLVEFLRAEASDFASRIPVDCHDKWIQFRLDKISKFITKTKKASRISIASLSNMGFPSRSLELSIRDILWDSSNKYYVSLCPCGRDDHWGWLKYKKTGN